MLKSFFPANWEKLAREHGALKGLRPDKSPKKYLRVLLLHLGCGYPSTTTRVPKLGSTEKLIAPARAFSPWGYDLPTAPKSVA